MLVDVYSILRSLAMMHLVKLGIWFLALRAAGVEFPPREENSVPLFTPPQTHPIFHMPSAYEEAAVEASLESDPSGLSVAEIQSAEGLADVLTEDAWCLGSKESSVQNSVIKGARLCAFGEWRGEALSPFRAVARRISKRR